MIKAKNEGLEIFWFCSNTSSKCTNQIKKDGNTCLYFYDGYEGVMLRGFAEVSYDDDIRKSFWQDDMVIYYPQGYLDPDFALIKFTTTSGNYYKDLHNEDFGIILQN
jgi:general stress protein 26